MSRATIKDIAKRLGVSPSTISRALADHPDISVGMKEQVNKIASELHYIKNRRASALRTNEPGIVALIIPEINMFFMPELIFGVNTEAEKLGLSIVIFQSDNSYEKEKRLLNYCMEMSFSGILLCLSFETKNLKHLESIIEGEIPVILLDKVIENNKFSTVSIRDEEVGYKAGKFLIRNGHQHVLSLFGNPDLSITRFRKKGFRRAFDEAGFLSSNLSCLEVENILALDGLLQNELNHRKKTTAIFCMSDELTINTHHFLMKSGLEMPGEISLFSISDGFVPYYLYPNISHLHHSGFEVGIEAIKEMEQYFGKENHTPQSIKIETKLFEMDSVINLNGIQE